MSSGWGNFLGIKITANLCFCCHAENKCYQCWLMLDLYGFVLVHGEVAVFLAAKRHFRLGCHRSAASTPGTPKNPRRRCHPRPRPRFMRSTRPSKPSNMWFWCDFCMNHVCTFKSFNIVSIILYIVTLWRLCQSLSINCISARPSSEKLIWKALHKALSHCVTLWLASLTLRHCFSISTLSLTITLI